MSSLDGMREALSFNMRRVQAVSYGRTVCSLRVTSKKVVVPKVASDLDKVSMPSYPVAYETVPFKKDRSRRATAAARRARLRSLADDQT